MSAQLQPPSSLCLQGNLVENWKIWLQKFELFCSGIASKLEDVQCAMFLHVAGEEAIRLVICLSFKMMRKIKLKC